MLNNCTLVISGPLISRINEEKLSNSFEILRELNRKFGLKIIITTYENEISKRLADFKFKTVINPDPGPDVTFGGITTLGFKSKKISRNTTRMLESTVAGLKEVTTSFVIKTRVELLPTKVDFANVVIKLLESLTYKGGIVFIAEHFFGLSRYEKAVLGWVPDTFQIMKTEDCLSLWSGALNLWYKYNSIWTGRKFHFHLTNEQVIGLAYFQIFLKENNERFFRKYHKYSCSIRSNKLNFNCESQKFRSIRFKSTFLEEGRLVKPNRFPSVENLELPLNKRSSFRVVAIFLILRIRSLCLFYYGRFLYPGVKKFKEFVKLNSSTNNWHTV